MYVCICHGVTERTVAAAIACGAHDEESVRRRTGAGGSCGACADRICDLLRASAPAELLPATG